MRREIKPVKRFGGSIKLPGDKSVAHRAALLSIFVREPIEVFNFPQNQDCTRSLSVARAFGVGIEELKPGHFRFTPAETPQLPEDCKLDCGNSGTTARLLAGILAGSKSSAIIHGDASLSVRPMKRIVDPLRQMGGELFDTEGHLPLTVRGSKLLPFEYRLPVASAQVKSAILLAGLSAGCSVTIREDYISRDHTEIMIGQLGGKIEAREIKAIVEPDPVDPRKKRRTMPEDFKKEILLGSGSQLSGGEIDIPGDASTASFFLAIGALSGQPVTIENMMLNPTRTGFLDYLKSAGAEVSIEDRSVVSGEPRGRVTVCGKELKARKLAGEKIVGLIDEIPILAVLAAKAEGTTVIRDAAELRVKETDRLAAIAHNLELMGVSCGVLEDGLVIEGAKELNGADLKAFGDHRIAMAFSVAALFAVGPSTIDDDSVVGISCPEFYDLLNSVAG